MVFRFLLFMLLPCLLPVASSADAAAVAKCAYNFCKVLSALKPFILVVETKQKYRKLLEENLCKTQQ